MTEEQMKDHLLEYETQVPMNIEVKRIEGDDASITLQMTWNAKTMSAKRQQKLWKGIGMALAAVMSPDEGLEFLAKLQAAKDAVFAAGGSPTEKR